ncbi:MAG: NADH-quinone oxidoreductase subunit D [Candidatus Sumerlaeia bacterium]|nr:NADH-quinone oxidoreductase subunit D [Candidatus Sumerlaeia bacterium]
MPELIRVGRDEDRDTYHLNMGPQHPSTHGVLRLRLHLKGEVILSADPIVGYSHRAHEKMAENRNYIQFLPNTSRMDYLSGMIYNVGYCQAIEKIIGLEVPERAEYIRVICCELNRISSHLLWYGTLLMDLGGFTPFLYCFEDRERILDILDLVSGSRLTYCYGRFGGVTEDVDDKFLSETLAFCKHLRNRLPEYDDLVTNNVIFQNRCKGIGHIDKKTCHEFAVTGPCQRAAGEKRDVRRDEPYGIYDRFDFKVPTRTGGDCFDRFMVRVEEISESLSIVEQAISKLPVGPVMAPKVPRKIAPAKGEYYFAVESARGHFGMYIVSNGTEIPERMHFRTPSFSNLATMRRVLKGSTISDTVAILGSIDIVLPEIDR